MRLLEQRTSVYEHEEMLFREYDFFPHQLERYGNVTKIYSDRGVYALKRTVAGVEQLTRVHQVLKRLQREGYEHVLTYHPNKFGDPFVTIDKQSVYVLPWIDDVVAEKYFDDWEARILEAMAKLHRLTAQTVSEEYRPTVTSVLLVERWSNRLSQLEDYRRFAQSRAYLSPFEAIFLSYFERIRIMVTRAISYLHAWQKKFEQDVKRVVFTHGQLFRHHVLHTAETFYLLNFDYAQYDSPARDLAKFFRKYLEKAVEGDEIGLHWLSRYEEHFPLSSEEKSLFAIMLLFPERVFREVEIYYQGVRSWHPLKHAKYFERQIQLLHVTRKFVKDMLDPLQ